MSALFIQKFYRGYVARKLVTLIRKTRSSVVFQKYVRRWLAKQELMRLRRQRAAIAIQTKIRVVLAKKVLRKLKDEWILKTKTYVCIQIQSHYRRRKAVQLRGHLKRMK